MSHAPPQATTHDGAEQREVVREHFDTASTDWGQRYERQPRRMSDLDLQMRRETARAMLADVLASASTRPLCALDLVLADDATVFDAVAVVSAGVGSQRRLVGIECLLHCPIAAGVHCYLQPRQMGLEHKGVDLFLAVV